MEFLEVIICLLLLFTLAAILGILIELRHLKKMEEYDFDFLDENKK